MQRKTPHTLRQKRMHATVGLAFISSIFLAANAATLPGGTLDPTSIPKYITPLVIPPVMPQNTNGGYDIAVRQFQQQILPVNFPSTTVWSYGREEDQVPDLAPSASSTFNYPAFTIEAIKDERITINWINDLTDKNGNYLPHLVPIDQTLHWANPMQDCRKGPPRTDCQGNSQDLYTGPVPVITHVHGAHTTPESDGFPEAWYLPAANNLPAGIATEGSLYSDSNGGTPGTGSALFEYSNDQPSATLWYHDHTLGMTRANVYAGPAGFYLIREKDGGETYMKRGILPGPAPALDSNGHPEDVNGLTVHSVRGKMREIPIVIQDRSFNADGSLFYPDNRAFFEGISVDQLQIPFIGDANGTASDISPRWNPEAFFNTMVVNGSTWPKLQVAPALYRFRLLNGANSRFLNLALFEVDQSGNRIREIPFFQIGSDLSLLKNTVKIRTGFKTKAKRLKHPLLENNLKEKPADHPAEALLMGPAERMDVIVDFRSMTTNTRILMVNTAPDAPFGGFPDTPADPVTTGQVMMFEVNSQLNGLSPTDPAGATPATHPWKLKVKNKARSLKVPKSKITKRKLALLEEESTKVCATEDPAGNIIQLAGIAIGPNFVADCEAAGGFPFAPKAAVLGNISRNGSAIAQLWSDPIRQTPRLNSVEEWELWNLTADAHPIHLHLVKFRVIERRVIGGKKEKPELNERGWKDTVVTYPGEITKIRAKFDIPGLYVWHCHILEHEDNEMMVPFCVGNDSDGTRADGKDICGNLPVM
ncbi:MAG: multicopper oxidase domain-containing protein [Gammaproteobacteria bacterium]|nr:multicopper oxidase domain-containing protein [Gammaproteobacteria bacterium]MCF6261101.1 multicopper oxidase domain-containing protein [Gammaproteobacteria bacterium]